MRKLMQRLKNYPLGILLADLKDFIVNAPREMMKYERRIYCCEPEKPSIGRVLLCYVNHPFFRKPGQPMPNDHTNRWESWQIAKTFLDLGYSVDVINENNDRFVPAKPYSIFVGNRTNFDRIAPLLSPDCIKILHIDTSHWLFHNLAECRRLEALKERRGVVLRALRNMVPNLAIEHADYGVVLGNEATISTYSYAKKPLFALPISSPLTYPWPDNKDFAGVRKTFLWFGSNGFVHKGLDLVLEAFTELPEYRLLVCGPLGIKSEKEFVSSYHKALYATENIEAIGWVDVTSPKFLEIARSCIGLVFPSCSEGLNGGVITCMHAGLIPVVSYESGVDVDDSHGVLLRESSVQEIKTAVKNLSLRDPQELAAMAKRNWELARAKFTRETFAATYSSIVSDILHDAQVKRVVGAAPGSHCVPSNVRYPEALK